MSIEPRPPWAASAPDGQVRAPSPPPPPGTAASVSAPGILRPQWGLPSALIGLAVFIGLQLIAGLVAAAVWRLSTGGGNPPTLAVGLASLLPAYVGVLVWQYLVARKKGNGSRADYAIRFRWYDIGTGIGGGLVAMGLVALGTLVVANIFGMEPKSSVGTTVLESVQHGPVLYAFLAVIAFVGPLIEELHFRGMWWRALANKLNPGLTLLLTSILFAVVHLEPVRMLGLLLGGALLGALRLLFGRLGPSIIAHATLNTISAISLLLAVGA
ncbi:MAG: lysostaphin resistance A-like protein [Streptosporangiales bacterium]